MATRRSSSSCEKQPLSKSGRCDRLKGFPYRQEPDQMYAIHRGQQRRKMWSRVRNPLRACSHGKSRMITLFCWSGLVFTFGALILSFYKDSHDEDEQSIDIVFDLSVGELVLTLIAVFITLAKQATIAKQVDDTRVDLERHSDTPRLSSRDNVSVVMPNDEDELCDEENDTITLPCTSAKFKTSKYLFLALFGWLTSSIIVIGSFVGFYIADRNNHAYLQNMKYTTAFVLFLSVVCDAIITEIFHEALAHAKLDVCRLVALQLKSELYYELRDNGKPDRVDTLEQYLLSTKQFSEHKTDHIVLCDSIFVFSKDRLAVDSSPNRPKFENLRIDRSPQTEVKMTTLMKNDKDDDKDDNSGEYDSNGIKLGTVKSDVNDESVVMEFKELV